MTFDVGHADLADRDAFMQMLQRLQVVSQYRGPLEVLPGGRLLHFFTPLLDQRLILSTEEQDDVLGNPAAMLGFLRCERAFGAKRWTPRAHGEKRFVPEITKQAPNRAHIRKGAKIRRSIRPAPAGEKKLRAALVQINSDI